MYAVGGYDGQSRLSSVECYDSFSNRWTEVAPMKEAVSSPAVASCAGKLFVIGGGPDDDTCSDKVGKQTKPDAPRSPRKNHILKHKAMTAEGLSQLVIGYYTFAGSSRDKKGDVCGMNPPPPFCENKE